ncbi:hypothetical protein CCACVL1_21802 [Corchorus capsularis]|uniref:Uncharacterized protein n=1 Tax=Corchorus capsularis TaxID=210143 RepID=A0A1R3H210_COCAP|nr:hypothetical protein CCACVL1_21802 [Corchorus capsularis]
MSSIEYFINRAQGPHCHTGLLACPSARLVYPSAAHLPWLVVSRCYSHIVEALSRTLGFDSTMRAAEGLG